MMKYVFVACVAFALMHKAQAFKLVTIQTGASSATPDAPAAPTAPAAPALNPGALLQGVQSAITGKLQQIQTLVGSLLQQKMALKQNALNSIQSALSGVKGQVGKLAGNIRPPFVIHKQIYIGPPAAEPTTSATTDTTSP